MFITLIKIVFELIGGRFSSGLATVNDYTLYNYKVAASLEFMCVDVRMCLCESFYVFAGFSLRICVQVIRVHCDGNEGASH